MYLQDHGVDDIGVLDGQIEGHAASRGKGVTPNLAPGDAAQAVGVVDHNHREQRGDPGAERVTREHHAVVGAVVEPQAAQRVGLLVEEPNGGLEEAVVDEATIEHLHPQAVVQQQLVVALLHQVQPPDGQHDLAVLVVRVDDVGGRPALGLLVGDALHDPVRVEPVPAPRGRELRVPQIGLVHRQDEPADARRRFELLGGGRGPGGAVVGAHVGAALPRPAQAA